METPKLQAIKAAYGEHWDKVKDYVDEDGWIKLYSYNYNRDIIYTDLTEDLPFLKEEGYERKYFNNGHTHYVRPKSLSGIETNRGWTRIESEEDLPKHNQQVFFVTEDEGIMIGVFNDNATPKFSNSFDYYLDEVTHYQPIEVPKPPIF